MNFAPLSALSNDEQLFFDEVEKFARTHIGPKVLEMDEAEKLAPEVLSQMFELGLMGIEVPGEYGGAEGSFMMAILAIQALSRVDPSVSVVCDVTRLNSNTVRLNFAALVASNALRCLVSY